MSVREREASGLGLNSCRRDEKGQAWVNIQMWRCWPLRRWPTRGPSGRERASERATTRSAQKHMETFLYLGVALKTEQTNFIHLRICGVADKHPALSLNTDSMLHSVFNYSEGGCNYVMFTICEPSLLAQPHTLCAMSTAAANYTDIQAGRSIHKHTTTHWVTVCVCVCCMSCHTHTLKKKHGAFTSWLRQTAFVLLPEKYQIKAWHCFERQDVCEVRVHRLERRRWRRTLGMREAGCVGSLLQWSRSKLQVTWRSFGPGGVFIHSLQKKHFKHDHCCLQSFPERTAPALWVLKPGGLAPEPGD